MKDVLALQQLNEAADVLAMEQFIIGTDILRPPAPWRTVPTIIVNGK